MPGMNGAELAERVAQQRADLPFLLVTGYADPHRIGAKWRGPVLSKPFEFDDLAAAVKAAALAGAATQA